MSGDEIVWAGAAVLADSLRPITDLVEAPSSAGDAAKILDALRETGQVRPVLVSDDSATVVARQHIVDAARKLGWTHVAVRLAAAEELVETTDQLTFLDAFTGEDAATMVAALGRKTGEADDATIEEINEASANPDSEWVGLPEFVPAEDSYKVIVSCETEDDRDALFDVLGIATIHKGTRGTLSVWWPDRARKDLASIRFVAKGTAS